MYLSNEEEKNIYIPIIEFTSKAWGFAWEEWKCLGLKTTRKNNSLAQTSGNKETPPESQSV